MGRDKAAKPPEPAKGKDAKGDSNKGGAANEPPKPIAKGHKQRGAGTVITAKAPVVTQDGITLKAHERLPSQLLHEFCQREKRPLPRYNPNPPGLKFQVFLEDGKNSRNDMTFAPNQPAESDKVAKDYAALLALFHFQKDLPLERKLPEPFASTWLQMVRSAQPANSSSAKGSSGKASAVPVPTSQSPLVDSVTSVTSTSSTPSGISSVKDEEDLSSYMDFKKYDNKNKNSKAVVLDENTADWLCDQCNTQNFAKLLSGVKRMKCFKCQTPKSASCTLVAPTGAAAATTTASTSNSTQSSASSNTASVSSKATVPLVDNTNKSEVRAIKAPPKAMMDLTNEKKYVSVAEKDKVTLQRKLRMNRSLSLKEAIRRSNRPTPVFLSLQLRKYLQGILGLTGDTESSLSNGSKRAADGKTLVQIMNSVRSDGFPFMTVEKLESNFQNWTNNVSKSIHIVILEKVIELLRNDGFSDKIIAQSFNSSFYSTNSNEDSIGDNYLENILTELIEFEANTNERSNKSEIGKMYEDFLYNVILEQNLQYLCLFCDDNEMPESQNSNNKHTKSSVTVVSRKNKTVEIDNKTTVVDTNTFQECQVIQSTNVFAIGFSKSAYFRLTTTEINDEILVKKLFSESSFLSALLLSISCIVTIEPNETENLSQYLELAKHIFNSGVSPNFNELDSNDKTINNTQLESELELLASIYDSNMTFAASSSGGFAGVSVKLEQLSNLGKGNGPFSKHDTFIDIFIHNEIDYPHVKPLVTIRNPAFADNADKDEEQWRNRLMLFYYCTYKKCDDFLGDSMIFNIISFVSENCLAFVTQPNISLDLLNINFGENGNMSPEFDSDCFHAIITYFAAEIAEIQMISAFDVSQQRDSAKQAKTSHILANEVNSTDIKVELPTGTKVADTSSKPRDSTKPEYPNNHNKIEHLHSFWSVSNDTKSNKTDRFYTEANVSIAMRDNSRNPKLGNNNLPALKYKEATLSHLINNQAIVITGETGCGKTTQVPQFVMQMNPDVKVIVCQPRRISAVSVAERVATEVQCKIGSRVGYMVRGDVKVSRETRLVFCTYGVLLRRLQSDPSLAAVNCVILDEVHERGIDQDLCILLLQRAMRLAPGLRVVIMSATMNSEKVAQYLGKNLRTNNKPANYCVPIVTMEGRIYPVKHFYRNGFEDTIFNFTDSILSCNFQRVDGNAGKSGITRFDNIDEKYDDGNDYYDDTEESDSNNALSLLYDITRRKRKGDMPYDQYLRLFMCMILGSNRLANLLQRSSYKNSDGTSAMTKLEHEMFADIAGTVLVFLPGVGEINTLKRHLQNFLSLTKSLWCDKQFGTDDVPIMILHGSLNPQEQNRVLSPLGNTSRLRIVLSTNVAEASLTIPDVTVVVDSCGVKEMTYDPSFNMNALVTKLSSVESLNQRSGRAGRVSYGRCFRMISETTIGTMRRSVMPEILRLPLEKLVLQVMTMKHDTKNATPFNMYEFLSGCLDPPDITQVVSAEQQLIRLQLIQKVDNTSSSDSSASRLFQLVDNGQLSTSSTSLASITGLGLVAGTLPCDLNSAKTLAMGCVLRCVFSAAAISAARGVRGDLFVCRPSENQSNKDMNFAVREAKKFFMGISGFQSDHLAIINAIKMFEKSANKREFCRKYCISFERMQEIRELQRNLINELVSCNLIPSAAQGMNVSSPFNANEDSARVLLAMVNGGLYPTLAKIWNPIQKYVKMEGGNIAKEVEAKEIKLYCEQSIEDSNSVDDNQPLVRKFVSPLAITSEARDDLDYSTRNLHRVFVHSSSAIYDCTAFTLSRFVVYSSSQITKLASTSAHDVKAYLRDVSEVLPLSLLFFGGNLEVQIRDQTVTVDQWIRFSAPGRVIALIQAAKRSLDALLTQIFNKINDEDNVGASACTVLADSDIVTTICNIISSNGMGSIP